MIIEPLKKPLGSAVNFGVEIDEVDLENLTDEDFLLIQRTLYKYQLVLFKNQQGLSPKAQYELARGFDPTARNHGHGDRADGEQNLIHKNLKAIPHQPEVTIKGNGFVESYEGLENLKLRHPTHRFSHRDPIPDEKGESATRFLRWHIDAALYDIYPPKVTTLMAVQVPKHRRQTILYDDGSGEKMDASLATTAFVSGQNMFDMLSAEDQEFVQSSKVEYAPHPYNWIRWAKSRSNGLGLYSEGHELPDSDLPPFETDKILTLPMAWKNPETGKLALQVHPVAIRRLHLADGTTIDDLAQIRDIVYRLQRPAISPQYVYAHDWTEGDMVLFHNQSMLHSVVGTMRPDEVRLFRQCNLASSEPPSGP